jgi:hypothetical protein
VLGSGPRKGRRDSVSRAAEGSPEV